MSYGSFFNGQCSMEGLFTVILYLTLIGILYLLIFSRKELKKLFKIKKIIWLLLIILSILSIIISIKSSPFTDYYDSTTLVMLGNANQYTESNFPNVCGDRAKGYPLLIGLVFKFIDLNYNTLIFLNTFVHAINIIIFFILLKTIFKNEKLAITGCILYLLNINIFSFRL